MAIWVKNTDGKPDAALTFSVWAVVVCLVKVLLAGAAVTIGGRTVSAGVIDAGIIGAVLTPTLGAYVARRYTDRVYQAADTTITDVIAREVNS